MSVLPLIDALILAGWSCLMLGFVLKAIYVTTSYRPTPLGFVPMDFLWMAGVCLLFALSLAGRTWVKAMEPELAARRRRARLAESGYPVEDESLPEPARRSAAGG
jgi:hypothetical protein